MNSISVGLKRTDGSAVVRKAVRTALLLSMGAMALPQLAAAAEPDDVALEEVVVSGTRVVRDGYEAPTPVSVVTAAELQSFASTNIADALKTLPSIAGSWAPESTQVNASSGNSGINALNLRNIGTGRTLVLVNGQRLVASSATGLVDINNIPQELVERVEVVTGGASASWGSDAVGGVVNFILDQKYTGLKASLTGGTTTYGDNNNGKFTLTGGKGFAGDRGHILFSVSADRADPIIYNRRDWNLKGWQMVNNPAYTWARNATTGVVTGSNDAPARLILDRVSTYQGVIGGVITSYRTGTASNSPFLLRGSPLVGTAFGAGGTPYDIQEGFLVQGDRFQQNSPMFEQLDIRGKHGGAPLASRMRGMGGFLNTTWDLNDDVTVGLMLSRNRSQTANWPFSLEDYDSITILAGNPFIPASVKAAMTAGGVNAIKMGSMHPDLDVARADGDRTVTRAALSFDGKFGEGWHWNAYYQYGGSKQFYQTPGMWNTSFLTKAYDAVVDPASGNIVCRVKLTNPNDPCVPYNPFGIDVNSQSAVNYVQGNGTVQTRMNHMSQNVASASIDGSPFSLWAGEVSVAAGAEWRREWMGDSWVDDMSVARQWWAGNALPSKGKFNVKEAFVETVVPLAKDMKFAQSLDLQGAVRVEDYSTSGTVTAWKVGTTWKMIDSLTLRGSVSHDIRAPNLNELYSNGAGGAPFVTDPWRANSNYGTTTQTVGNPLLLPEVADSWGAGLVFKPAFLPGFGASVDYWYTSIDNAIGSAGGLQTIVDNCYTGQTEYCSLITWEGGSPGGRIQAVKLSSVNNANAKYRGVDFESSYRFNPAFMPGDISLRLLGTRYLENSSISTTGVYTDIVGQNGGNVPKYRYTLSANWTNSDWSAGLSARGLSSGVYNNYWVVCSSGCPISQPPAGLGDSRVVTINNNHIKGAIYFDGSVSKNFLFGEGSKANVFLNVRNLLNKDPAMVASSGSFSDTTSAANPSLYDVLGRVFSAGVRVEF